MGISKVTFFLSLYIIISAAFMRSVLNFLKSTVALTGVTVLIWGLLIVLVVWFIVYLLRFEPSFPKMFLLIILLIVIVVLMQKMHIVEERYHIVQFGLLGFFVIRDACKKRIHGAGDLMTRFFFALVYCTMIVAAEEGFQWFLPNRVADVRDVVFGIKGSILGIITYAIGGDKWLQ